MKLRKNLHTPILILIDIALLAFSLAIALALRGLIEDSFQMQESLLGYVIYFFPVFIVIVTIFYISLSYNDTVLAYTKRSISKLSESLFIASLIGLTYFYIFSAYIFISPKTIYLLFVIVSLIVLSFSRVIYARLPLLGAHINAFVLMKDGEMRTEFINLISEHIPRAKFSFPFVLFLGNIVSEIETSKPNIIIYDNSDKEMMEVVSTLPTYILREVPLISKDTLYENTFGKIFLKTFSGETLFRDYLNRKPFYEFIKRVFDLVIAIPFFIFTIPFIVVGAIAIFIESGRPVFIFQDRVGLGRRIIRIPKLRTMTRSENGVWTTEGENKITKVGAIIRKTRIDEFPQLWSVIKGDQSLVGPRPDMTGLESRLSASIPFYHTRYTVVPGASGWAQVTQSIVPQTVEETRDRFAYDMYYLKNRSIMLDLSIALKTVRILLSRVGR